jgi:hypothetical protein
MQTVIDRIMDSEAARDLPDFLFSPCGITGRIFLNAWVNIFIHYFYVRFQLFVNKNYFFLKDGDVQISVWYESRRLRQKEECLIDFQALFFPEIVLYKNRSLYLFNPQGIF